MASLEDIVIGVSVNTEEAEESLHQFADIIRFISQQTQAAVADFQRFEQRSNALGTSVSQLTGLSNTQVNAFRDWIEVTKDFDDTWRLLRINIVSAYLPALEEMARSTLNTVEAVRQLDFPTLGKQVLTQLFPLIGMVDPPKRARLNATDTRALDALKQPEFDLSELQRHILRNAFIAQQRVDLKDPRGVPSFELQRRQQLALEKFDIQQKAQKDIQTLRSDAFKKALSGLEDKTTMTNDRLQNILDELRGEDTREDVVKIGILEEAE